MTGVFFLHNSDDKLFVGKLTSNLLGIHCFCIDEVEMQKEDLLIENIKEKFNYYEFLAVVLSPSSVGSELIKRGMEILLNEDIVGHQLKVLPILLSDCEVPSVLQGEFYADFRTHYTNGFASLLNQINPGTIPPHQPQILVIFKDGWEKPLLYNWMHFTETVANIRQMNPADSSFEGLWVEILFDDFNRLNRVNIMADREEQWIDLEFDIDIGDLIPNESDSLEIWETIDKIAIVIKDKLNLIGSEIMSTLLNAKDMTVSWGGINANTKYIPAAVEILYNIDNEYAYVIVTRKFKKVTALDKKSLKDIHFYSSTLINLIDKVVQEIKEEVKDTKT